MITKTHSTVLGILRAPHSGHAYERILKYPMFTSMIYSFRQTFPRKRAFWILMITTLFIGCQRFYSTGLIMTSGRLDYDSMSKKAREMARVQKTRGTSILDVLGW